MKQENGEEMQGRGHEHGEPAALKWEKTTVSSCSETSGKRRKNVAVMRKTAEGTPSDNDGDNNDNGCLSSILHD